MPTIIVTDEELETLKTGLDYYNERIDQDYESTQKEKDSERAEVESVYHVLLNAV